MNLNTDTRCIHCTHFRNSPAYLESVYKGLTSFSSGYASVRRDDGICLLRDLYLSADASCHCFAAAETSMNIAPPPAQRV